MKKIATFLLATALVSAQASNVQYAEEVSLRTRIKPDTGALVAIEEKDSNGDAQARLMSVTPSDDIVEIVDGGALRRNTIRALSENEWSVSYSDAGITVISNTTYKVGHRLQPSTNDGVISKTITVVAANGLIIDSVDVETDYDKANSSLTDLGFAYCNVSASVKAKGSVADITVTASYTATPTPGESIQPYITPILTIKGVKGSYKPTRIVNDVRENDWLIQDKYGVVGLGGIRSWMHRVYDGIAGTNWFSFAAGSTVRLQNNRVNFDHKGTDGYTAKVESLAQENDSLVVRHRRFEVVSYTTETDYGAGATFTNKFEITKIILSGDTISIWVSDVVTPDKITFKGTTDLTSDISEWTNVSATYELSESIHFPATEKQEARDVWSHKYIIERNDDMHRFYRAVANGVSVYFTIAYFYVPVYASEGVMLQSPNGNWWKLKVDDSGALSTESAKTPLFTTNSVSITQ